MKNILSNYQFKIIFVFSLFLLSCGSDDEEMTNYQSNDEVTEAPVVVEETKSYELNAKAVPDISGQVIFKKNSDNTTTIELELSNTPAGGQHPAHIHANTAAEGGAIALTLGPVDGNTGKSSVTIATLDDGSAISYDQLLDFNGYINVHLSADDLATIVAQGDIGSNELTGASKMYMFGEKDVPGISGMVTFYERKSNSTLAKLSLMNTPDGGVHPAHIHNNSAAEGGGIAFSFTPVDGSSGMSATQIAALDDGTPITYEELLEFDGYVNVHLSADELGTIVSQGDIGGNELTGTSKAYELSEKDVAGISGMATFYERQSGEALAVVDIMNTPAGGIHPAHIHQNDAASGGPVALSFNPVNGDTGRSTTHIAQLNDGTAFGYDDILSFDGYINVHLSAESLSTIVAQGNIGVNEGDDENSDAGVTYSVGNQGATAYIFSGGDFDETSNPELTLKRGVTYQFVVNTPGHPFLIKTIQSLGTTDTYDTGVVNNGAVSGMVTFTVPADAPDTLYYICEFHSSMSAIINIID